MTKTYSCSLTISESGNFATISATNGRVIAEFTVDGCLAVAAFNAVNNLKIQKGRVNIFRGELFQLRKGEILNPKTEQIHSANSNDAISESSELSNELTTEEMEKINEK